MASNNAAVLRTKATKTTQGKTRLAPQSKSETVNCGGPHPGCQRRERRFHKSLRLLRPLRCSRAAAIISPMFTGLVEELGTVHEARRSGDRRRDVAVRLVVKAQLVSKDAKVGDSIAVNGCCLTVVKKDRQLLAFDAGSETLSRTNLGRLEKGHGVNLERSIVLGERLGGHLVMGHIDGPATLLRRRDEGDWSHFTFRANSRLLRQMASKC